MDGLSVPWDVFRKTDVDRQQSRDSGHDAGELRVDDRAFVGKRLFVSAPLQAMLRPMRVFEHDLSTFTNSATAQNVTGRQLATAPMLLTRVAFIRVLLRAGSANPINSRR
jgi:hypothetical protein